ncbi:galactokinase [Raineyella antarctica]|uniref:Galactokinase n=1 Tax=Raineyella antarctica TaxID=1577474 RepID=A0A1G6GHQ0_9ACTN|nr:galactokinase [Raineyella antarctica]SDB81373.1 galactokinase [Raineyella antarctica]
MTAAIRSWSEQEGAERATELFERTYGTAPDGVWAAPGRVNLIGEHIDYNGGPCLPIALPHRTYVALRRRPDDVVRLASADAAPASWEGSLGDVRPGGDFPSWVAYAAGPAWALSAEEGARLGGFEAAIVSCVPWGAGLSSSAAIECAMALALDDAFGLGLGGSPEGRARLAAVCVRAENEVAGAPTGGMDQAAALRSTEGHALLLDTLDGSVTQVPFDLDGAGLALLVVDTRAKHALGDGQYASRRAVCEAVAEREGVPTLGELVDPQAVLARLDDPVELRRVRHVVTEIARVREAVGLLAEGRFEELGRVLDASHASLRDDYEVSVAELDEAVEASRTEGALGARMTGGGFGGSAIALVPLDRVEQVEEAVTAAFVGRRWIPPHFLVARAAAPGGRVRSGDR